MTSPLGIDEATPTSPPEELALTAEQKRRQELQQKVRELLGRLGAYLATVNRLETALITYPFKDQRIYELQEKCRANQTKLNISMRTLNLIVSQDTSEKILPSVKAAYTQLYAERQTRLPMEGDSLALGVQNYTEQEKLALNKLEGTTQEFSTVVDRIQQIILEAQRQFKDITQGDFNTVIGTLGTTEEMLGKASGVIDQMQNPAVVGEKRAKHYAEGLAKFRQIVEALMKRLTDPNLIQTTGGDKEGWKRPLYGDFQNMIGALQDLKEHRYVLGLRDSALKNLGEIQAFESMLRSLQLRDPDLPHSLE